MFFKDDPDSIRKLTQKTAECFGHERVVRLLYIRAQVTRIDLKIDLALAETMRVYRHILASSTILAGVPIGTATNKFSAAIHILRAIKLCFGVPSVSSEAMLAICRTNLWDDLGNNALVALAKGLSILGVFATISTLGVVPMFIIPMVLNIPLAVPQTARMFLGKCFGQPLRQDIEKAVLDYKPWCRDIHRKVKNLVPKFNIVKTFRMGDIEVQIKNIIEEFKSKAIDGVGSPSAAFRNKEAVFRSSTLDGKRSQPQRASSERVSATSSSTRLSDNLDGATLDLSEGPQEAVDMTDQDAVSELLQEKMKVLELADP